jgi:NiFe hydrogenase small subunit HydA
MLGTLALPERYLGQVVQAVSKAKKPVLLWLQFQDCTGCSESMLRSSHPDVGEAVLDLLSWEYHEVIMAGAGKQADAVLDRVVKEDKGKYLAVVEGAIPTGEGSATSGAAARWRSPIKSAGTRRPPLPWALAPSTAAWCARVRIPRGLWAFTKRCPGSR